MAMLQPSMNEASQPAVRHTTVLQEIQQSTDAISSVLTEVQQTTKPSRRDDSDDDESELRVTNTKKPIRIRKKKVVVSFLL